ncbi:MAG: hypothetical protein AB2809_11075 [Candidatus Thiodiazotropha sp.]
MFYPLSIEMGCPTQAGIQFDGMVAISEGLSLGEWIVVRGNETLRDGQQITIQEDL